MIAPASPVSTLSGKAFVVTGASRGIGLSLAQALARRGARVGMIARTSTELGARAAEIGEDAFPVSADLRDKQALTAAIDQVAARFGGLSGIINNAGVSRLGKIAEADEADVRAMFEVNVFGVLFAMQAAIPHLRAAGGGTIINVSSASVVHRDEFPFTGPYAASKAALERLSLEARDELKREGIAVCVFRPGATMTHVSADWSAEQRAQALAEWARQGETFDGAMSADVVGEAIAHMLESPPGTAYDLVELRPNTPTLRRAMQA